MYKKTLVFFGLTLFFLLICFSASAKLNDSASEYVDLQCRERFIEENKAEPIVSSLPNELRIIGESAFEGTALVTVYLPNNIEILGNRSFANNQEMLFFRFSENLRNIEGNPFAESKKVALGGSVNNVGYNWANKRNIRYFVEIMFSSQKKANLYSIIYEHRFYISNERKKVTGKCSQCKKEERKGRAEGELKSAFYGGVVNLYINSRYFP